MIYLVDMDDVLADFDRRVLGKYHAYHPDKLYIPPEEIKTFYVQDSYPAELRPLLEEIFNEPGIFSEFPPVPGGIEAIKEIAEKGHEVFICTTPLLSNPTCVQDKYDWIGRYLGRAWQKRLIPTRDKTMIHGDYLVDDKPEVTGIRTPTWTHVLYTKPCNAHIKDRPRIKWTNYSPEEDWRKVLHIDQHV
jgi:5'-nucleotidase